MKTEVRAQFTTRSPHSGHRPFLTERFTSACSVLTHVSCCPSSGPRSTLAARGLWDFPQNLQTAMLMPSHCDSFRVCAFLPLYACCFSIACSPVHVAAPPTPSSPHICSSLAPPFISSSFTSQRPSLCKQGKIVLFSLFIPTLFLSLALSSVTSYILSFLSFLFLLTASAIRIWEFLFSSLLCPRYS